MIIVSDSSPLHYLIAIGKVEVLRALFGSIVVPGVVVSELTHAKAPEAVRGWMLKPPDWLTVRDPLQIDRSLPRLDAGEAAAISLAKELPADALLIDDRRGKLAAQSLGLVTIGTLAVIERAAADGLLELSSTLDALLATNFRAPADEVARLRGKARPTG